MTALERFVKAINFEKTDTIPIFDIINNKKIYEKYAGEEMTAYDDILPAAVKVYKTLGIDVTRGFYRPNWQEGVVNSWIKYLKAPENGWKVEVNEETSWVEQRPFSTLSEFKKNMIQYPDEKLIEEDFVDDMKRKRDSFSPDTVFISTVGGFLDLAYRYMGYELFVEGMYDDPGLIDEVLNIFHKMQVAYSSIYAKHNLGPAYVYCDDIAFKTSLLFSPAFLREKYFPRLREIFEPAQSKGIKVIYHSDGNLNSILDDLVDVGIDALNPLELLADMDIVKIRKKYPDLALVGGIDCSELLSFGSFDDIKKEVVRIIDTIGKDGGIILGSTSEIHSGISAENCSYLYKTIKELGAKI